MIRNIAGSLLGVAQLSGGSEAPDGPCCGVPSGGSEVPGAGSEVLRPWRCWPDGADGEPEPPGEAGGDWPPDRWHAATDSAAASDAAASTDAGRSFRMSFSSSGADTRSCRRPAVTRLQLRRLRPCYRGSGTLEGQVTRYPEEARCACRSC